jgi:hypothetical protein
MFHPINYSPLNPNALFFTSMFNVNKFTNKMTVFWLLIRFMIFFVDTDISEERSEVACKGVIFLT